MGPRGCPETSVRNWISTIRCIIGRKRADVKLCLAVCFWRKVTWCCTFLYPNSYFVLWLLISSPFCIKNSVSVFRRCRWRVGLRAHWVYENPFRNLLNFTGLAYTVAKNCRGTYGIRVRWDVRLACCDVILSRVNLKTFLRNVLSAFAESPPLRSVCLCQTAWP
jgi:hypothetical protein